jgi:phage tail-like protein
MQPPPIDNFRYLNRQGRWLDFQWSGLRLAGDGALELLSAPRLDDPLTALPGAPPSAPGGIAVDDTGRVFTSLPDENRIVVAGGCDPAEQPLLCLTESPGLGPLAAPRGLLVLNDPERLVIADSDNRRLVFCDLVDFAVREVWGLAHPPAPLGQLDTPWTVAAESDGRTLYVLDAGRKRVDKYARTGDLAVAFGDAVASSGLAPSPGALAVSGCGADVRIFIADLTANAIFVFDRTGTPLMDGAGTVIGIRLPGMGGVLALAASETALFVGDNAQSRILAFGLEPRFPFAGEAGGFRGTVVAMAVDPRTDSLLVQTGGAARPVSLHQSGSYLSSATLWSKPLSADPSGVTWNRLRAWIANATGSHVEFYYALSNQPDEPPVNVTAADPFQHSAWQALPVDVADFLLAGDKVRYLFLGARFSSDRSGTPRLSQLRVDFNTTSFTQYLPAIYRQPGDQTDFLKRLVSLFQGLFEDVEDEIAGLEQLFDPMAAPAAALPWLATWLAVDLDQGESEARMRGSIAHAFQRYRWRGTVEGLRLALLEDAGVHAVISEPIAASTFFAMGSGGDCSGGGSGTAGSPPLGIGTVLSSMEAGGATLGSTAVLDRSYLITDAQFGEPLFEGAAWQFVIEVHRREAFSDVRLQLIRDIVDREKPAHTMYRLVVIDPAMRVGRQARLGIDSVVAGGPGPGWLGDGQAGLRLGGTPPPQLGVSRLGEDLKL